MRDKIKTYENFPKLGISFKDLNPLYSDHNTFKELIYHLSEIIWDKFPEVNVICGIESRGFIVGAALANAVQAAFIPIRKAGKLPGRKESRFYALEYGLSAIEIPVDLFTDQKVVIVDDVLATGGTINAAVDLITDQTECEVLGAITVAEIVALGGRNNLDGIEVESLLKI